MVALTLRRRLGGAASVKPPRTGMSVSCLSQSMGRNVDRACLARLPAPDQAGAKLGLVGRCSFLPAGAGEVLVRADAGGRGLRAAPVVLDPAGVVELGHKAYSGRAQARLYRWTIAGSNGGIV